MVECDRPANGAEPSTQIGVSPRRVLAVLLAVAALIALATIAGELSRNLDADDRSALARTLRVLRRNFSPSGEQTVGTWFTASVLLGCGLLLALIAATVRARGGPFVGHWRALGAIFVFLSCDEAVALHEQLGDWVRDRIETGGPLLWAWVIPYGAVTAALAVAYVPFVRALPEAIRRRVVVAGAFYVGGALVLEMVQAAITDARDRGGGPVSVVAVVEETTEQVGAILFLWALLGYLAEHAGGLVVAVQPDRAGTTDAAPVAARARSVDPGD